MKSMEEMMAAAQKAAETIQNQMGDAQAKLDSIEVEGTAGARRAAGGIGERIAQSIVHVRDGSIPGDAHAGDNLNIAGREDLYLGETQVIAGYRDAKDAAFGAEAGDEHVRLAVGAVTAG